MCIKDFLKQSEQTFLRPRPNSGNHPYGMLFRRARCSPNIEVNTSNRHSKINFGEDAEPIFKPAKAVILTKMTRYEYEKTICEGMSDNEFRDYVSNTAILGEQKDNSLNSFNILRIFSLWLFHELKQLSSKLIDVTFFITCNL